MRTEWEFSKKKHIEMSGESVSRLHTQNAQPHRTTDDKFLCMKLDHVLWCRSKPKTPKLFSSLRILVRFFHQKSALRLAGNGGKVGEQMYVGRAASTKQPLTKDKLFRVP